MAANPSAACCAVLLCAACAGAGAAEEESHRNVTAGGTLRPGVYGRIAVRGAAPPPVIFAQPVVAQREPGATPAQPAYLYVPSGQVRKWAQHCAKWQACSEPVLFVRMEGAPGRWGDWRMLRATATAADGAN